MSGLQLTLDGADRLVAALQERGGTLGVVEAARILLAAPSVPRELASRVVGELVSCDCRLARPSALEVELARAAPAEVPLERTAFCVVDLETTGTRSGVDRIVEIGCVRIEALELQESFERLVDPGVPLPPAVQALTGISTVEVHGRVAVGPVLEEFLEFSRGAILVAHNARFDCGFLDAELLRHGGRRLACRVLDTVLLARRLLPRAGSVALGALAARLDTNVRPNHRALPDALATAEILLMLIGSARARGARTASDLLRIGAPPAHAARLQAAVSHSHGPAGVTSAEPGFERRLEQAAASKRARPGHWLELTNETIPRLRATRSRAASGLVAGPVGSAQEAREVAEALRTAHGLRRCDVSEPREGHCLEGRLSRCSAPCRGVVEAAAHAAGVAAARAMLEGCSPLGVRRLRDRRDALVLEQRFEEAARLRDAEAALRRAAAALRAIREARRRHGVVLTAVEGGASVVSFAVAYGVIVDRQLIGRSEPTAFRSLLEAVWRAVEAGPGPFGQFAIEPEREQETLLVARTFRHPPDDVAVVPLSPAGGQSEPDVRWLQEAAVSLAAASSRFVPILRAA